ncbi:LamG-like jellyroll fold domain-containing protein [uncultured Gimesia sp.]|uniref:LamG-like jellyroll fold domain-containing protein n=1 Tax=uncultured Gimesia sp. TaxID=1678688 RepID=UPI0026316CF0|nr:LamG-like jellyroll fold domain-containing protein [uncultured Gimesia sp.]
MASHIWIGGAPAIAQVEYITVPSDVLNGYVCEMAIGVKTLSVEIVGTDEVTTTAITAAAEIIAAWNASVIPEFAEITASAGVDSDGELDGRVKLTALTAGIPFTVTVAVSGGSNEVQLITVLGATGGTFTLTFGGQTTSALAYNASAATLETAFEGLGSVGSGNGTVTGDAGGPYTIEFTGALAATDVALITTDASSLTGSANEVQTITILNAPTGGTFTLSYDGESTTALAYNASAATIEAALLALNSIPSASVSCGGGALPGSAVTVTFQGALALTDVPMLIANSDALTGMTMASATSQAGGSSLADKAVAYWNFNEYDDGFPADYDLTWDLIFHTDVVGGMVLSPTNNLSLLGPENNNWLYQLFTLQSGGIIGGCITSGTNNKTSVNGADSELKFTEDEPSSFSIWFKPVGSFSSVQNLMSMGDNYNSSMSDYSLRLDSSGYPIFRRRKGTSSWHEQAGTTAATIDAWNLVVGVWDPDNSTIKISINGGAFEETTGLTVGTTAVGSSVNFQLMSRGVSADYSGYMDSVGVFNDVLTISEVGDLYNSGAGDDYPFPSGGGSNEIQTLTWTGTPSTGSVNLTFGQSTLVVPYNATAAALQLLLDDATAIGSGNAYATGGPWPGTALSVEFIGDLAVSNVQLFTVDLSDVLTNITETTKGVAAPTATAVTSLTPMSIANSVANSGPNNWDVAANFNTNTVPVTGDTVFISDTDISIFYGLAQSAVTLAALHIEQTFSGFIGLPRTNTDGTNSYFEYRDSYLKIGATLLNIGDKEGDGSDRIKIDLGTVQSTVLITDSGTGEDANTPAILLLGTHASNVIDINRGSLGVAYYPTEVSTIATLRQAFFDDAASDTTVYLGAGVTITDIIKTGGDLDINSATTTFRQDAGETTIHAGAHASLNVNDGALNYNSTGTATAISLAGDAVLNFNQDRRPKAVTTITKKSEGSEIYDDSGCISSPVIVMQNIKDFGQLHFASNYTVTLT